MQARVIYSTAYEDTASAMATLTKPPRLAVGDLLVFAGCSFAGSISFSSGGGGGWTALDTGSLFGNSFYKVADASDVAAANFQFSTSNGSAGYVAVLFHVVGADSTSPIAANADADNTGTSVNIFGQDLSTLYRTTLFFGARNANATWTMPSAARFPARITNNFTTTTGNDRSYMGGYLLWDGTGSSTIATGEAVITSNTSTGDMWGTLITINSKADPDTDDGLVLDGFYTTGNQSGVSTSTHKHTVSGSADMGLLAFVLTNNNNISGATYNGDAMTHLVTSPNNGGYVHIYGLLNPDQGRNDLVVSASGNNVPFNVNSVSYFNVNAFGDTESGTANTTTSLTLSNLAVTVPNSVGLMAAINSGGGPGSASNTNFTIFTDLFPDPGTGDSGLKSASFSMTMGAAGSGNWAGAAAILEPVVEASGNAFFLGANF